VTASILNACRAARLFRVDRIVAGQTHFLVSQKAPSAALVEGGPFMLARDRSPAISTAGRPGCFDRAGSSN
jgi:hypothetical protein